MKYECLGESCPHYNTRWCCAWLEVKNRPCQAEFKPGEDREAFDKWWLDFWCQYGSLFESDTF